VKGLAITLCVIVAVVLGALWIRFESNLVSNRPVFTWSWVA
jgi:hypothetical protein